jgi:acyl dehydratase
MVSAAAERNWTAGWQPVIDAVGTDFGAGVDLTGPDAVELGSIRRYVEPLEFGCPLHYDPEVAQRFGLPDVVAPVTSAMTFTIAPVWRPGEPATFISAERNGQPARTGTGPRWTGLEPPTTAHFAAEAAADYLAPIVVGDRLTRRGNMLLSCVPKATRIGVGAFTTWQSEIHNQRGELVVRLRNTAYSYIPAVDVTPPTMRPPAPFDAGGPVAEQPTDWDRQRRWEDVRVGDRLPTVRFPLSVYRLVMAAGANRDFNSIHHNTEWAQGSGAPEMFANVLFLQGMWERCARQFIGLAGRITRLSGFRMGSFNTAGDTVEVRGRVERVWREGESGYAELRLWSSNRTGVSVGPGSVTVSLPFRT